MFFLKCPCTASLGELKESVELTLSKTDGSKSVTEVSSLFSRLFLLVSIELKLLLILLFKASCRKISERVLLAPPVDYKIARFFEVSMDLVTSISVADLRIECGETYSEAKL